MKKCIVFLFTFLASTCLASTTEKYGCAGVESLTESEVRQLNPSKSKDCALVAAEPMGTTLTNRSNQPMIAAMKDLMKRRLFEALKEEALGDQIINHFKAWNYFGYGDIHQKWEESQVFSCVSSKEHPTAIDRMNQHIRERNKRYENLSRDQFSQKKKEEFTSYKNTLISMSQNLEMLQKELLETDETLGNLRSKRSQLRAAHPTQRGKEFFADEEDKLISERERRLFQIYLIKDSYPILQVTLPTALGEQVLLSQHLNNLRKDHEHNPNMTIDGGRPWDLIDTKIMSAIRQSFELANISIHGDSEKKITGLCNLEYSDEELTKLLVLNGLREKVLAKLDPSFQKLSCEVLASQEPFLTPFQKTALYLGGMGVACTLGWVTGPGGAVSCAGAVSLAGLAISSWEFAEAIEHMQLKGEEYKRIHNFFLSSVEGSSFVGAEQDEATLNEYKGLVMSAWVTGLLSLTDLSVILKLGQKGAFAAKEAIIALRSGAKLEKEVLEKVLEIGRRIALQTGDEEVMRGVFRILQEAKSQDEVLRFMQALEKLQTTPKMKQAILKSVGRGNFKKLKEIPCLNAS